MRYFTFVFLLLFLTACNTTKEDATVKAKTKKVYDLYEPSEMANYMNVMYDLHEKAKEDILAGNEPEDFSAKLLEIHTAELSGFKERNQTFESFSHLFVERVLLLFDEEAESSLEERYNDVVNLCISCHQTECTGPIPRIKKLLIH